MPLPLEKSDHLYAIIIKLVASKPGALPANLNRAAHAQVITWITQADPELGDYIHSTQDTPLSISDLIGDHKLGQTKAGDEFLLRVGILQGDLLAPLLKGIEQNEARKVDIANLPFSITGICAMPGSHPLVGTDQYSALAKMPRMNQEIVLDFLSPTSFKQEQYIQPFPLPHNVFGSLLKRWNTFAPKDYAFPQIEWKGLVAAYESKSKVIKMKGGPQIGSVGWVRYQFPNVEQAHIANVLAHFAYFAGVGRKTAQGMGQTHLRLPTDKSRPKRANKTGRSGKPRLSAKGIQLNELVQESD